MSDRVQCRAKSKNSGKQCKNWAILGGTVCRMHGGKAKQVKAAAERRYRERKILAEVERLETLTATAIEGETDPLGMLQKLTVEATHFYDALKVKVNELESIEHESLEGTQQAQVAIDLYLKAMDRVTKLLDIALKHDIEGKRLALEQAKADAVAEVFFQVLTSLGLTAQQMDDAQTGLYRELTKLADKELE